MVEKQPRHVTVWLHDDGDSEGLPISSLEALNPEVIQSITEAFSNEVEDLQSSPYKKQKQSPLPTLGLVYQ